MLFCQFFLFIPFYSCDARKKQERTRIDNKKNDWRHNADRLFNGLCVCVCRQHGYVCFVDRLQWIRFSSSPSQPNSVASLILYVRWWCVRVFMFMCVSVTILAIYTGGAAAAVRIYTEYRIQYSRCLAFYLRRNNSPCGPGIPLMHKCVRGVWYRFSGCALFWPLIFNTFRGDERRRMECGIVSQPASSTLTARARDTQQTITTHTAREERVAEERGAHPYINTRDGFNA